MKNKLDALISMDKAIILNQKELKLNSNEINLLLSIYYLDSTTIDGASFYEIVNESKEEVDNALLSLTKKGYLEPNLAKKSNIDLKMIIDLVKLNIIKNILSENNTFYIPEIQSVVKKTITIEERQLIEDWIDKGHGNEIVSTIDYLKKTDKVSSNLLEFSETLSKLVTTNQINREVEESLEFDWLKNN